MPGAGLAKTASHFGLLLEQEVEAGGAAVAGKRAGQAQESEEVTVLGTSAWGERTPGLH
jgi:hypothetical protein